MNGNSIEAAALRGELEAAVDALVDADAGVARASAVRLEALDRVRVLHERLQATTTTGVVFRSSDEIAARSLRAEVACALRIGEREAESRLAEARMVVHDLPEFHSAVIDGRLSERHVRVMVDEVAGLDEAERLDLDRRMTPVGERSTSAVFRRHLRRAREQSAPHSMPARHRAAVGERCTWFDIGRDGMADFVVRGSAVEVAAIDDRIHRIASAQRRVDGETRTIRQLRSDAAVTLLLGGVGVKRAGAAPGETPDSILPVSPEWAAEVFDIRPTVHLTIPFLALLDGDGDGDGIGSANTAGRASGDWSVVGSPADGSGASPDGRAAPSDGHAAPPDGRAAPTDGRAASFERSAETVDLAGVGPIDPMTAARWCARAPSFTRLLTDPITGALLALDRSKYRPTDDQRAWLRTRDVTCRFPGCGQLAHRCEIDHTAEWVADGGPTDDANLASLCTGHHTLKTATAWGSAQHPDGTLEWTSPLGRRYTTTPGRGVGPPLTPPLEARGKPGAIQRPRGGQVDPARPAAVDPARQAAVDPARQAAVDPARQAAVDLARPAAVGVARQTVVDPACVVAVASAYYVPVDPHPPVPPDARFLTSTEPPDIPADARFTDTPEPTARAA